jgi:hypothetical protein
VATAEGLHPVNPACRTEVLAKAGESCRDVLFWTRFSRRKASPRRDVRCNNCRLLQNIAGGDTPRLTAVQAIALPFFKRMHTVKTVGKNEAGYAQLRLVAPNYAFEKNKNSLVTARNSRIRPGRGTFTAKESK